MVQTLETFFFPGLEKVSVFMEVCFKIPFFEKERK